MMVKNCSAEGKLGSAKNSVVAVGVLKWKRVRMSAIFRRPLIQQTVIKDFKRKWGHAVFGKGCLKKDWQLSVL